jgi:hypothetical protein
MRDVNEKNMMIILPGSRPIMGDLVKRISHAMGVTQDVEHVERLPVKRSLVAALRWLRGSVCRSRRPLETTRCLGDASQGCQVR